ncbi:Gldg family protein [bacterium]|nr:Gldg family protein [bacterium]
MKKTSIISTVGILLIAAVLVLVNLIANTRFFQLDLTEGKVYSLSQASKQVVSSIEDPLTIKVFASENLSAQLNDVKRYLNDLLAGYRSYGGGELRYEFVNPGDDEELEQEAQSYRIPPFQENVWNKDQLELKKVYLGLVILYGDKQETIPMVRSTSGLEYNLTSMIKRVTSQQSLKVGFLQGHGEPSPFESMQQANGALESNYQVTAVDLTTDEEIPADLDALIIAGLTEEIPDDQKLKIDQYIMKGGSVGWFMSKIAADLQQSTATKKQLKIDEWNEHYGFRINNDLVADWNAGMVNIQQRVGFFQVQNQVKYPFFPIIQKFNPNNVISDNLEVLTMFFPSSIDTNLAGERGMKITPLFFSSERTKVETSRFDINATQEFSPEGFNNSHVALCATLEGKFTSYFADKDIPEDADGNPVANKDDLLLESPVGSRMVVAGDGKLFLDDYLTTPANVYVLLNSIDWLVGDTDLISLRSREISMRPLKDIPEGQKEVWKYVNWFLPPILIILLGLVYWQIRRNTRVREI